MRWEFYPPLMVLNGEQEYSLYFNQANALSVTTRKTSTRGSASDTPTGAQSKNLS